MKNHTEVLVTALPNCDFCEHYECTATPAGYNANTRHLGWAYLCETHFAALGCELGLGRGQKLVVKPREVRRHDWYTVDDSMLHPGLLALVSTQELFEDSGIYPAVAYLELGAAL